MPIGKTFAKPMSLMTWKAIPQPSPTLPPVAAADQEAAARLKGAKAEMIAPMVSLVISSGSRRRVAHQRQNRIERKIIEVEMKASAEISQVTGIVQPSNARL